MANQTHTITFSFAAKNYKEVQAAIRAINGEVDNIGKKTKPATDAMGDFEKALRRAAIVAPVWMALRTAMQSVLNLVQEQTKFLIEMETAMARIEIVGKGTTEEYNNMKDALVALSFAYGKSATDALEAAQIFAQQGKDVKETLILTQQAMLAAQVLGTDTKTVVNDLTAALNGFKIPMQESVSIIDKWIGVEKEFAVTSKDLAEATKVTGATANQLGLSISEFLGDVTAVIEVTRKSGSEAARGLGFIYARLLTSGKETIQQITKIPFYLDKTGKTTNEMTGTLRNASDILGDLAGQWNTLTNEERLQIAESLGSKRQMTVLNALMQNYSRSIDARVISLTSAGQAERAFNIIQDTTAFKLEQTKSAWNNLTNAIGDTKSFKQGIDIFNDLLNGLTLIANEEKGTAAIASKLVVAETNKAEKYFTEAANLRELIKLRNQLEKSPASDANTKRIEDLNKAIDTTIKDFPTEAVPLKLSIEVGNEDVTNKLIDDIQKQALKKAITVKVQAQYIPKIATEQAGLNDYLSFADFTNLPVDTASIEKMQGRINSLIKEQNDEIEKQFSTALGNYQLLKGTSDLNEQDLENVKEITSTQREQLDIERQLSNMSILQSDNVEARIKKEIELVQNSKFLYDAQAKQLKLEQLNNQLIDARLQKRKQEMDEIKNLVFQYEKADLLERPSIRRQIELQSMSDEQVVNAYQTSNYDANLIRESISSFSQAVQDAIAKIIATERGIYQYNPVQPNVNERTYQPLNTPTQITKYTPVEIGSIPVTVNIETNGKQNTPESTADEIANALKESILSDERYLSALRQKI